MLPTSSRAPASIAQPVPAQLCTTKPDRESAQAEQRGLATVSFRPGSTPPKTKPERTTQPLLASAPKCGIPYTRFIRELMEREVARQDR